MATLDFRGQLPRTDAYYPAMAAPMLRTGSTLDHIEEARGSNGQGRANGDDRASDEDLAKALQLLEDELFAMSFDQGAEANHPSLHVVPATSDASRSNHAGGGATEDISRSPTPDLTGRSTAESSVAHRSPGNSTDDLLLFERYPIHSPSQSDIHLPLDAAEDVHIDKGKRQDLSDSIPPSPLISQNPLPDLPDPQSGKGKERDVAEDLRILSDEAYALMLQTEDLINTLQNMGDAQLSETLDQAWGVEPTHPSMVELVNHTSQIAAVLRQAQAISVAAGNALSGPSALSHEQQVPSSVIPPAPIDRVQEENIISHHNILISRPPTPNSQIDAGTLRSQLQEEVSPPTQDLSARSQCIICTDLVSSTNVIRTPCDHDYCRDCVVGFVEACTRDSSILPLRCCNRPIPKEAVTPFLTPTLLSFFEAKCLELEVPVLHRIFCQSPDCGTFLGSTQNLSGNIVCPKCTAPMCSSCKQPPHTGESCSENAGVLEVRTLAQAEHWQTCPGCNAVVELHQGCHHMTCRCGTQFCYLCAALWKECPCPQFA